MEEPKDKGLKPRIKVFTWYSKQELYEYFKGMYNLDKPAIDQEIEEALKSFGLRKGMPINTKELWQKVGNAIESRLSRRNQATALYKIDRDTLENMKNRN